jgi:hypothetical protein
VRTFAIVIAVALIATPQAGTAQGQRGSRPQGGGGGGGFSLGNDTPSANRPAGHPNSGGRNSGGGQGGFNLANDAPSSRTPNAGHPTNTANRNVNNNGNRNANNNGNRNVNNNGNTNVNNNGNRNVNNNGNTNVNNNRNTNVNNSRNTNVNNSGNRNVNVSGNNVNVNRNVNVNNGYGYRGAVVVNPVYRGPAWGWNHGVAWAPVPTYWGGGFWGPFAAGVVMGAIINSANNQKYTSYQVNPGSPGAQLLSNYQLQQVPCGPPNLVVIYGPNNGVICAKPNHLVAAGTYAVNADTLSLQSP